MKPKTTLIFTFLALLSVFSYFYISPEHGEIPDILKNYDSEVSPSRSINSIRDSYEKLSACEKEKILWHNILKTEHTILPDFASLGALEVMALGRQSLKLKGELKSDVAPKLWKKYLHRRASVAKVKIIPQNNSYSGLFQGADCAILRLSLTFDPSRDKAVAPGLALKVLRNGMASANISALVSIDGQAREFNFFKNRMSNIVPIGHSMGQKLVHTIFSRVSKYPEELLAQDFAAFNENGTSVREPHAPRQLFFVPNSELNFSSDAHDVRNDFSQIPEGTLIYKLYALTGSDQEFDYSNYTKEDAQKFFENSEYIADIVTTSNFVASSFGDDQIFFKHEIRAK